MQKKPVPKCENNVTTDAKRTNEEVIFSPWKGEGEARAKMWSLVWAQGFFFVGYFVLRGPGFCFVYRVKNAIGKYISEEANKQIEDNTNGWYILGESIHINRNTDITYILNPSEKNVKSKLSKGFKRCFRLYLSTSFFQMYRYTWAYIFQHLHLQASSLLPCAGEKKGDRTMEKRKLGWKSKA